MSSFFVDNLAGRVVAALGLLVASSRGCRKLFRLIAFSGEPDRCSRLLVSVERVHDWFQLLLKYSDAVGSSGGSELSRRTRKSRLDCSVSFHSTTRGR